MSKTIFKDPRQERELFVRRIVISGIVSVICIIGILLRLIWLQIHNYDHFRTKSHDNRVKLEPIPPIRGLIYEAHHIPLAENVPTYSLEIVPEKVADVGKTIDELRALIPISDRDIRRFKIQRKRRRRFDGVPLREQLTEEEIAKFAVNSYRFVGVSINVTMLRHYPLPRESSHVLGYVGSINERELKTIDTSRYSGTKHIGKSGLEKSYEDLLHGQVGMRQVEVNARGRVLQELEAHPPQQGHNLHLYLDLNLQREADRALGEESGALVAIDPRTGGVLALVSKPSYDPNLFVTGISHESYNSLTNSPERPLYNRALRGQYPPGSTVKPFVGLAGLEAGIIRPTDRVFCPGYYKIPGQDHKYRDWRKTGHGDTNIDSAITESCDVYFYVLARNLGIDSLHDFLSQFSFGKATGIDLSGELGGLVPSREWKRIRHKTSWYPGETLIMGIGQGYMLATPLQLASATATLAARGRFIRPRVVRAIEGPTTGGAVQELPMEITQISRQSDQNWQTIITAMQHVIESSRGTAKSIATSAYHIAGKTGTAQVFTVRQNEEYDENKIHKKMRDHALFVAFAPVEDPRIAIAVLVENGGHGGAVAAPIARRVMDMHLLHEDNFKLGTAILDNVP